jgi:hypothetical protein
MFVLLSSIHFGQGLGNVRVLGHLQLANQTVEIEFVGQLKLAGQDLSTAPPLGASPAPTAPPPKSLAVAAAKREPIKLSKESQKAVNAARVPMQPKKMGWREASLICLQGGPLTKSELYTEAAKIVLTQKPAGPHEEKRHKDSHYQALRAEEKEGNIKVIKENSLLKWALRGGGPQ